MVPDTPPVVEDDDPTPDLDERWARRWRVSSLRLRGFTEKQIADAVNVHQSTVSRDLAWWRQHHRDTYGASRSFDPDQEIGEAIALYREAEVSALRDYVRFAHDPAARARFLIIAMLARDKRLARLQDVGCLGEAPATGLQLGAADVVRALLREAGHPIGPVRAVEDTDAELTAQWLASPAD